MLFDLIVSLALFLPEETTLFQNLICFSYLFKSFPTFENLPLLSKISVFAKKYTS